MDKNNIIGITLIFILFFIWARINSPTPEQLAEQQRVQDSIQQAQVAEEKLAELPAQAPQAAPPAAEQPMENDSMRQSRLASTFGPFASSAAGIEKEQILENELVKITFTSKGGRIKKVLLKNYYKLIIDSNKVEQKIPLYLLEDEKNKFEYFLPMAGLPSGGVKTSDLYFQAAANDSSISFKASAGAGRSFEQIYSLAPGSYNINYEVRLNDLNNTLATTSQPIKLFWDNYLDRLEINYAYEKNYSSAYYKIADDSPGHCSCTSDDEETISKAVKWVSCSNQFFNSSLMAKEGSFKSAAIKIQMEEEDSEDLKRISSELVLPFDGGTADRFAMDFFVGPNEFTLLQAYDAELEDIIPYGSSIFGTINRWVIRPIFGFLSSFIGSKGIVILVLTLIVKLLLYPLTYKMLYSQSKMAALKPQMASVKEKHKGDQQTQQMETMKMYREFGVNPLGGCLPIALQMPIWFALYRFFPASIEFRQASFLWATDLSSYDVFAWLPSNIPFYGEHISLFTLLWAGTTVIYTFYNTKHMDMSMNPAMKYMQYLMPVFFLFFFNNFAAGLTCYLLFSNVMNIGQTLITKNYIIDQEKIKREMEAYRKKPKKKGGFQERLEAALRDQQKQQAAKQNGKSKGKKQKKK